MLTSHQLTRVRRQSQRRLRLLLAQRRTSAAHNPEHPPADPAPPGPQAEPGSAEPPPEH